MSNQYILPIGYAWVDYFLDTNKQMEHIVLVMHDIYPDLALISLSSNKLCCIIYGTSTSTVLGKIFDETAEKRTMAIVMMESLQQVSYRIKLEKLVKHPHLGPTIEIDLSLRSEKENLKLLSKVPRKSF